MAAKLSLGFTPGKLHAHLGRFTKDEFLRQGHNQGPNEEVDPGVSAPGPVQDTAPQNPAPFTEVPGSVNTLPAPVVPQRPISRGQQRQTLRNARFAQRTTRRRNRQSGTAASQAAFTTAQQSRRTAQADLQAGRASRRAARAVPTPTVAPGFETPAVPVARQVRKAAKQARRAAAPVAKQVRRAAKRARRAAR